MVSSDWLFRILFGEVMVIFAFVLSHIPIIGSILVGLGMASYILCFLGGVFLADMILHPEQLGNKEVI